jgi:hypothetical protein
VRLSIYSAAGLDSRPKQFYFTSYLIGGHLMFRACSRQVKQSIAVTIDRAPVAPFESSTLRQLDPGRYAT